MADINSWDYWNDSSGLPYEPYGVIRIVEGEMEGNPTNHALIHMRMFSCDPELTDVADSSSKKVPFYMALPSPHPITGTSLVRFSIEESAPVSLTLYDVQGRRVTTLLNHTVQPAGVGLYHLDSSRFASGVYFLRLESKQKYVSRKVIILH
jgi:hypothetical protein